MKLYKRSFILVKMNNRIIKIKNQLHFEARKIVSALDYLTWAIFDRKKLKTIDTKKIKKILVVFLNQKKGNVGGDFVTLGVLNCFKKEHPEINLTILSDKSTIKQFGKIEGIEFIEYTGKKVLEKIKRKEFDAVLLQNQGELRTKDFSFIPYKIGETHFGIKGFLRREKFGYTRKVHSRADGHMVDGRFKLFEALGFKFKEKKPFLEFTEQEEEQADNFIKKNKIEKFVIIHPGGKYVAESFKAGKWPPYLWNIDRYSKVADHFIQKGYKIIITGSKEEEILFDEIVKKAKGKKQILNSCGELSMKEVGALLKRCKLLVATDTSIVHFAYQVGIPIVELMGPTPPETVGAWPIDSPKHKILVDKGPRCNSMRKLPYKDNFNCLENIKTEDVISASDDLLKNF